MEKASLHLHPNNEENMHLAPELEPKILKYIIDYFENNNENPESIKFFPEENITIIKYKFEEKLKGDSSKFTDVLEKFHKAEKSMNQNQIYKKKLEISNNLQYNYYFAYKGYYINFLQLFSENDQAFQDLIIYDKKFAKDILRNIESIILIMAKEDIKLLFNIDHIMFDKKSNKITLLPTEKFLNTNFKHISTQAQSNCNEAYINIWILALKLILGGFTGFVELQEKLNQESDSCLDIIKILEKDFDSNSKNKCFYQFLFEKYVSVLNNRRNEGININEIFKTTTKEEIYFLPLKSVFNFDNKLFVEKVETIKNSIIKLFPEMGNFFNQSPSSKIHNDARNSFQSDVNKIVQDFIDNPKGNNDKYYSAIFLISCLENLDIWEGFNRSGVELIKYSDSSLDEKNDMLKKMESEELNFHKNVLSNAYEIIKIIIDLKKLMKNPLRKDDLNKFFPAIDTKLQEIVNQPIFKMKLDKDQLIEEMKKFEVWPINDIPEEDKAFNRDPNEEILPNNNSNKLKAKGYSSGNQLNIKIPNFYSQELENCLSSINNLLNNVGQNLRNFNERSPQIIQKLEEQISHCQQQIKEMEAKYNENRKKLTQDFTKDLEGKNYELQKLNKEIVPKTLQIEDDQKSIEDLKTTIKNQEIHIEKLTKEIEDKQNGLEKQISTNYPQEIEKIKAESNEEKEQIIQYYQNILKENDEKLQQSKDVVFLTQKKNAEVEISLNDLKTKSDEQLRQIVTLAEENKKHNPILTQMDETYNNEISKLKKELSEYKGKEKPPFLKTNSANSTPNRESNQKKDNLLKCGISNSENVCNISIIGIVEQKTQNISKNYNQSPISLNQQRKEDSKEKKEHKYENMILHNSNPNVNPNPTIEVNDPFPKKGNQSGKNIISHPYLSLQNPIPSKFDNPGMNRDSKSQLDPELFNLDLNKTNNENLENKSENEKSESFSSSEEKKYEKQQNDK